MARRIGRDVPSEADLQLTSQDRGLGETSLKGHEGQNRAPRYVESQAGRKPGFARHTAGAKSQATRAARAHEHKASASAVEKKITGGGQKAGKQKREAAQLRAMSREAAKKKKRAA